VQYVPCLIRPDRQEARQTIKATIGGMLANFWPVDSEWPPLRNTIVEHSHIPKSDVVTALERLRRGDPPATVLDDRFVEAFAIAGNQTDFIELARHYRAAGVTELALTFAGPEPEADMMYLSEAVKLQASAV